MHLEHSLLTAYVNDGMTPSKGVINDVPKLPSTVDAGRQALHLLHHDLVHASTLTETSTMLHSK